MQLPLFQEPDRLSFDRGFLLRPLPMIPIDRIRQHSSIPICHGVVAIGDMPIDCKDPHWAKLGGDERS